jgi:hypothetical protein
MFVADTCTTVPPPPSLGAVLGSPLGAALGSPLGAALASPDALGNGVTDGAGA